MTKKKKRKPRYYIMRNNDMPSGHRFELEDAAKAADFIGGWVVDIEDSDRIVHGLERAQAAGEAPATTNRT